MGILATVHSILTSSVRALIELEVRQVETSATRAFSNDSIFVFVSADYCFRTYVGSRKNDADSDTLNLPTNDKAFLFNEVRRFADSDGVFLPSYCASLHLQKSFAT